MRHTLASMPRLLQKYGPFVLLLGILILMRFFGPPGFFSSYNMELMARHVTVVIAAGLGMTLVIICGGIDLSVGSALALSTVAVAASLQAGASPAVAAFAGIGVCVLTGAVQGSLIARFKMMPFIVTLGGLLVFRGLAKRWAHEQKIDAPTTWLNQVMASLPDERRWMLLPPGVWTVLLLAAIVMFILRFTPFGRHVVAVGSNEMSARLCGVPVERIKTLVYIIGGLCTGVGGVMLFCQLSVGDPTAAIGEELAVIAAVVIGGGSLTGGQGSIPGTIAGALVMTVIASWCAQMGYSNWAKEVITGVIIILAVALDRWRQNASDETPEGVSQ